MTELKLTDGGLLNYQDTGTGRPVVFLHGWGMRGRYFDPQVQALHATHRCVVPDLRGHGGSSRVLPGQGIDTLGADVAELLTALDLSDVLLVGWSMGAMVAWEMLGNPGSERISAVVTIDMVPKLLSDGDWQFGLRQGKDAGVFDGVVRRMLTDWRGFTRVFVGRILAQGNEIQHLVLLNQMITDAAGDDPESMARLWMSMAEQDFRHKLTAIELPCLVTYGARSRLYREQASQWLISHLPHARGICFSSSGHAPHLEEPDRFNEELGAFSIATGAANLTRGS